MIYKCAEPTAGMSDVKHRPNQILTDTVTPEHKISQHKSIRAYK